MVTVSRRIKGTKQPRGGWINPRTMQVTELDDGRTSKVDSGVENIHASLVGSAVDYMVRYLNGTPFDKAFSVSLAGAMLLDETHQADTLRHNVTGLDHASLANACRLVGYDVVVRAAGVGFKPVESIVADEATTANMAVMIERSLTFFKEFGPVTLDGFKLEDKSAEFVTSGDGDFLTADTVWDFKVSNSAPTKDHTLQLMMYYLMGKRSGQPEFDRVTHLGIFNPRFNIAYRIAVADIASDVIETISRDVIGYRASRFLNG